MIFIELIVVFRTKRINEEDFRLCLAFSKLDVCSGFKGLLCVQCLVTCGEVMFVRVCVCLCVSRGGGGELTVIIA